MKLCRKAFARFPLLFLGCPPRARSFHLPSCCWFWFFLENHWLTVRHWIISAWGFQGMRLRNRRPVQRDNSTLQLSQNRRRTNNAPSHRTGDENSPDHPSHRRPRAGPLRLPGASPRRGVTLRSFSPPRPVRPTGRGGDGAEGRSGRIFLGPDCDRSGGASR